MTETQSLFRTRFYSDCIGVFQGGGCRAAAFGGAYAAAYQLGVRFTEVAGTSAGSIVAALLAAGATPDYLLQHLRSLDFCSLLSRPVRSTFPTSSRMLGILERTGIASPVLKSLVRAARFGGIYSSERLEALLKRTVGSSFKI